MKRIAWSGLWKKEDWLTVWSALIIIIIVLAGIGWQAPRLKWTLPGEYHRYIISVIPSVDKLIDQSASTGDSVIHQEAQQLKDLLISRDRKAITEAAAALVKSAESALDPKTAKMAKKVASSIKGESGNRILTVFSWANLGHLALTGGILLVVCMIAFRLGGERSFRFVGGFALIFLLAFFAQFIAGNYTVIFYGLEYVIWALFLGLIISNVFGVPDWLRAAVRSEFYIKTGVILLGTGILIQEIANAGIYGLLQAVLVVSVVWYACFWIARKLKVDDEFSAILASAVSICGVSAAIATAGAIKGDPKKLSYTTSLVLLCAVPMLIIQPIIAKMIHMPDIVAGAWLGGTLDTSGSVVAAGSLISDSAMKTGVVVKMSQNVLIGVAAFILSIVWAMRSEVNIPGTKRKTTVLEIWYRFPKFVLGFTAASLLFSFLLSPATVEASKGMLSGVRTWWFAMAFVSIGLETRFKDLAKLGNGKPAVAFLSAQIINILWTLLLAYLIFGGILFPAPVI